MTTTYTQLSAQDDKIKEVMGLVEAYGITASFGSSADLPDGRAAIESKLRELVPVWLPIESAPMDGANVLITNNKIGVTQCAVWLSGKWLLTWEHEEFTAEPTHWMPLPKEPTK